MTPIEDPAPCAETGHDWPEPLAPPALSGLAGEVVHTLQPYTEADSVALLLSFLVAFGNLIGHRPHAMADGAPHHLNLFCLLVNDNGVTPAAGSWVPVLRLLEILDPAWAASSLQHGLASGPGLICAVRDPVTRRQPASPSDATGDSHLVCTDYGVEEKRLLIAETDFAPALHRLVRRDGTLAAVLRAAWDTGHLQLLTTPRARGARATGAHISLLGRLTRGAMLHPLSSWEFACDFASRFLWARVSRSKLLPDAEPPPAPVLQPLVARLAAVASHARDVGEITRDQRARDLWHQTYPHLREPLPGLFGTITTRAAPQVMRLASLYALLDLSAVVQRAHLDAALALWEYCRGSASTLLAGAPPFTLPEKLLRILQDATQALTRTEIAHRLSHHRPAPEISAALDSLAAAGLASSAPGSNDKGRPAELWCVTGRGVRP